MLATFNMVEGLLVCHVDGLTNYLDFAVFGLLLAFPPWIY